MGIVNLKWHKACAVRGLNLTKDERVAGWPESFALARLAILQCPDDNKMANILHRALQDACAANLIPSAPAIVRKIGHETETYLATGSFVKRNIYGERVLDFRERIVPVMKEVEVPAVTAADFAAWLVAQGERPSEHIAAWFAAVGVSADARAATPQPAEPVAPTGSPRKLQRRDLLAPLIERAQRECSDPLDTPAVFAVLMRMTEAREKPFIGGITEDGIQWEDGDDKMHYFSKKMLSDRLRRQVKHAAQPQKTPLKRVK